MPVLGWLNYTFSFEATLPLGLDVEAPFNASGEFTASILGQEYEVAFEASGKIYCDSFIEALVSVNGTPVPEEYRAAERVLWVSRNSTYVREFPVESAGSVSVSIENITLFVNLKGLEIDRVVFNIGGEEYEAYLEVYVPIGSASVRACAEKTEPLEPIAVSISVLSKPAYFLYVNWPLLAAAVVIAIVIVLARRR